MECNTPTMPPIETLAKLFPQFALALKCGVELRPDGRILQCTFSTTAPGRPITKSFDTAVNRFSLFTQSLITIDPTNAFPGNPWKTTSDENQAKVTGITVTLLVQASGGNYTPITDETPLQMAPAKLRPYSWLWPWWGEQNVKATFTINATQPAAPFTIWWDFSFVTLAPAGTPYLQLSREEACQRLRVDHGIAA